MKKAKKITSVMMVSVVAATLGCVLVQPAWAQTLPYTTGLDVWFDSSDMNGNGDSNSGWSEGNTLSTSKTWVNKGSAGNPNEYGRRGGDAPVFRSSVSYPNGPGPAVEFASDNFVLDEFMDSTNVSVFAVVQRTSGGTSAEAIFWDYGGENGQSFRLDVEGGTVSGFVRDSTDSDKDVLTVSGTSNIGTNVAIVQMILMNGTTMEAGPLGATDTGTNAAYDSSTTWEGQTGFPKPTVGAHSAGATSFFNGYIFELLIFDHVVTGADRTAVENYLTYKYITHPPAGIIISIR